MTDNFKFYIPAVVAAGIILYLSAFPGPQINFDFNFFAQDKIGHFIAYFTLSMTIVWGYFKHNQLLSNKVLLMILAIGIFYGYSMELMQYLFFPNRYFDYGDMLANFIGSLLGIVIFQIYYLIIK